MKLLKQIIAIHMEQMKRHKAMRILSKQRWSVEFLSALVADAARLYNGGIQLTVVNGNQKVIIESKNVKSDYNYSDSIFDKLDDEAAMQEFIAKHSTRG